MRDKRKLSVLISIIALLSFAACRNEPTNLNQNVNANVSPNVSPAKASANSNSNNANAAKNDKKEGHEHVAPHGGTLVVFGDEFAHLELVLDEKTGKLSAYALDGEAENAVRSKQTEIEIAVQKPSAFLVKLKAVANSLTGETIGDTSEFAAVSDELKNLKDFEATITSINIKGKEFKNVEFNFPKGNENRHQH